MNKKFEAVFLDFDGTLADTDPVIFETMNVLYDKYRNGIRTSKEEMASFSGPPIKETIKKEFPHMDLDFMCEEFKNLSFKLYDKYMIPFDGLYEMLKDLKDHNYKTAIISSKSHEGLQLVINMLNISNYIDTYVGLDDVKKGKPDPESFYKAMEILNIKDKNKVVYVGDNESDILACNNAGIKCVIARYTNRYKTSWKCDYTIGSLKELLEVIEND